VLRCVLHAAHPLKGVMFGTSNVELEGLRLLLVVAEQESFTRAATKLGITQSALSRQVQRLEREFSTRLFYRNGRGVQLTEAGTKLQRVGKEIFQSLDSLKEELTDDNSRFRGVVTLGLPPSLGATVSTGLVRRFQQTYPEARIKVLVAFSGTLTEWLEAGRVDVGVLYDVRRSATLLVAPLLLEPLYLVESASSRAASEQIKLSDRAELSELAEGPFVISSSANGMRRIVDTAAARLNIKMRITAEVDSLDAIKQMVQGGPERCVLPLGTFHREIKAGLLTGRRFDDNAMDALLVLATPLHKPVTKLASAVLRLVEQEVSRCISDGILSGMTGANLRRALAARLKKTGAGAKRA
jgi:LysR family nitrogen assimilation transcriptional regulator